MSILSTRKIHLGIRASRHSSSNERFQVESSSFIISSVGDHYYSSSRRRCFSLSFRRLQGAICNRVLPLIPSLVIVIVVIRSQDKSLSEIHFSLCFCLRPSPSSASKNKHLRWAADCHRIGFIQKGSPGQ